MLRLQVAAVQCLSALSWGQLEPAGHLLPTRPSRSYPARSHPHSDRSVESAVATTSVNVLDFGADPHSHNDSTAAFNDAFKHAQAIANGLGGADDGA